MSFIFRKRELLRSKRLMLFTACFLFTTIVSAQGKSFSLELKNVPLKEAIASIEKKGGCYFTYNSKQLEEVGSVSLSGDALSVKDALNQLLAKTDLTYSVTGDNVVIYPKTDSEQSNKVITVHGVVKDETGEPVIGATVVQQGTTNGTVTNIDGIFEIKVPQGSTIHISFVGYDGVDAIASDTKPLEIKLKPSSIALDQVVVTAMGIKRSEKALSYNVQKVDADEIVGVKDANFVNALNGKVAGVTINSSSSGVGGASKVVIRGTKGIAQTSNALYVIDGVPMYSLGGAVGGTEFDSRGGTEPIADINPEDIESVSVLTGAAAAALYGSHAANGAIVITTKKGKKGVTSVTLSSNTELMTPFVLPRFQNRYGTGDLSSPTEIDYKSWGKKLNASNYMGYTPRKDYFQTGVVGTESVSLSTGTEKNQTYVSVGAVNSKGIVPNNKYNRYNFTFRNTTSFFHDRMSMDLGATFIKQNDLNMINQGVYSNPLVSAYLFPRGNDWEDVKMYERYDAQRKIMTQYWPIAGGDFDSQNPYWINHRNLRENKKDRYMFNAGLTYDILSWLNVTGRIRLDNSVNHYTEKLYATSNTTLTEGSKNGLYEVEETKDSQVYGDVLLSINKNIGDDISLQANIGASFSDMRAYSLENRGPIRADGIPNLFNVFQLDDDKTKRSQSEWREQTQSVFGSLELGYKRAYYLTLTGRNDWPSQLAGPNSSSSSFFYPSAGASVVVSELIDMPDQLPYLKLRGSFASVGMPFARFLANPTYDWDNANKVWVTQSTYPMYNLKPERTDSWEIGLTTNFLDGFNLDLSYYHTKTYNQTFDPEISVSSKYKTLYVQTGSVLNKGIEVALGYDKTWNKFTWNSNFTASANQNKILELVDDYVHPETGAIISKDRLDVGGLAQVRFILKKGGTLGDIYTNLDLERDSEGKIYVDETGNINLKPNVDDIKLGSVFPKANLAWKNNFTYKNVTVGAMFSARIGGVVYSATQAALDNYGVSEESALARDNGGVWINDHENLISANKWFATVGSQIGVPSFYTYDATNVRLQEASISYTIPKKALRNVCSVTFSIVGKNLWMIYNKAPFDPEAVASTGNYYQGIDYFMMPSTRNFGFNIRVKF